MGLWYIGNANTGHFVSIYPRWQVQFHLWSRNNVLIHFMLCQGWRSCLGNGWQIYIQVNSEVHRLVFVCVVCTLLNFHRLYIQRLDLLVIMLDQVTHVLLLYLTTGSYLVILSLICFYHRRPLTHTLSICFNMQSVSLKLNYSGSKID